VKESGYRDLAAHFLLKSNRKLKDGFPTTTLSTNRFFAAGSVGDILSTEKKVVSVIDLQSFENGPTGDGTKGLAGPAGIGLKTNRRIKLQSAAGEPSSPWVLPQEGKKGESLIAYCDLRLREKRG